MQIHVKFTELELYIATADYSASSSFEGIAVVSINSNSYSFNGGRDGLVSSLQLVNARFV
jgi:hypothetical protein